MTDSPSVLLQRAADKLTELAANAWDEPWRVNQRPMSCEVQLAASPPFGFDPVADVGGAGNAMWIAAMSPVVAAPLVAWLRMSAKEYESREHLPKWGDPNPRGVPVDLTGSGLFGPAHWEIALVLARQVLGLRPSDEEAS